MIVVFASSAVANPQEMEEFLNRPSKESAQFSADVNAAVFHLSRWPGTAVRRRELTRLDVLFGLVTRHYLILKQSQDQWTVAAVLDCSRNIRKKLRQRLGKRFL